MPIRASRVYAVRSYMFNVLLTAVMSCKADTFEHFSVSFYTHNILSRLLFTLSYSKKERKNAQHHLRQHKFNFTFTPTEEKISRRRVLFEASSKWWWLLGVLHRRGKTLHNRKATEKIARRHIPTRRFFSLCFRPVVTQLERFPRSPRSARERARKSNRKK